MNTMANSVFCQKLFCLFCCCAFLFPFSLGAVSTFKGQLVYLKECRVCHLSSKIFVGTHSSSEWEKILDIKGKKLSNIHLDSEEKFVKSKEGIYKSSHKYFKSEYYSKKYHELRDFIIESAKKNEARDAIYRE